MGPPSQQIGQIQLKIGEFSLPVIHNPLASRRLRSVRPLGRSRVGDRV